MTIYIGSDHAGYALKQQLVQKLAGKFDAESIRVPTITGSLSVLTVFVEKKTSEKEVNLEKHLWKI